jgi:hypothetical protein
MVGNPNRDSEFPATNSRRIGIEESSAVPPASLIGLIGDKGFVHCLRRAAILSPSQQLRQTQPKKGELASEKALSADEGLVWLQRLWELGQVHGGVEVAADYVGLD